MPELKPCPFCGETEDLSKNSCGSWDVGCTNGKCAMCARSFGFDTKEEAIKAWNTRAKRTCNVVFRSHELSQTQTALVKSCSLCGFEFGTEIKNTFPFEVTINSISIPNYCPNCGAKVVKE